MTGIDKIFEGKVKEVDFIFEIFTPQSGEEKRTQKSVMVVRFDEESKGAKLNIGNYLVDKFSFDKLTD